MNITRENYEIYAVDYFDGAMNAKEKSAFEQFLNLHPDIKAEIEGLDWIVLEPQAHIQFPAKEELVKEKKRFIFPLWIGVAASLAFLVLLGKSFLTVAVEKAPAIAIEPKIANDERDEMALEESTPAIDSRDEALVQKADKPVKAPQVEEMIEDLAGIEKVESPKDLLPEAAALEAEKVERLYEVEEISPEVAAAMDEPKQTETGPEDVAAEMTKTVESEPIEDVVQLARPQIQQSMLPTVEIQAVDSQAPLGDIVHQRLDMVNDEILEQIPSIISFVPHTNQDVAQAEVLAERKEKSLLKETFARIKPFRNQKIDRNDVKEALLPSFVTGTY